MSNMSYCRFQNTFNDLRDCRENLNDFDEDFSDSEKEYRKKLINLCQVIIEEAEEIPDDEIEEEDENES